MQKRNVLKDFGIVTVLSVVVAILLNMLLLLINLPQYSERYQEAVKILYAPSLVEQILYSGILIPILEELIFRGLLFRLLRKWVAFPWAMIMSAVVFGAYHGNLVQFVYAGICGMVFAFLYEKYDSVLVPVWSHMTMNLSSLILTHIGVFEWMLQKC